MRPRTVTDVLTLLPIRVARSSALATEPIAGKYGPISGWANIEGVDVTDKWLIRVGGIDYGNGVRPITYEHPKGVINTVGHTVGFEVRQSPTGAPGLAFKGVLYLDLPMGRELYEVALAIDQARKDLGDAPDIHVSVEGGARPDRVRKVDGRLEIQAMKLDSLAITSSPLNEGSAWGPGYEWLPVAASFAAVLGDEHFARMLAQVRSRDEVEVLQSQAVSAPATDLAPLVPQSHQNAPSGGHQIDPYIVETLKAFPWLTWTEGEATTRELIALLTRQPR